MVSYLLPPVPKPSILKRLYRRLYRENAGFARWGFAVKRMIGQLLTHLRSYKHSIFCRRQRSNWFRERDRDASIVDYSLEFTGIASPYNLIKIGARCHIEKDITIWLASEKGATPELQVDKEVFVGRNSYIGVYDPISIGSHTVIGAYSYIISANHRFESREIPIRDQGFTGAPIVIEDDVWLGTHVVVLPGVTIGKGAIVAAGSVVNKDIPPYEIWGGMPAKFLKERP